MRHFSIIAKLNMLFLFGFFVISITAYLIYNRLDYRENYLTQLRFNQASKMIREAYQSKKNFPIDELRLMDLELITDPKSIKKTEKRKVISVPIPEYYLGVFNTKTGREFAIKTQNRNVILRDIRIEDKTKQLLVAGYIFAVILLILFYISIYRSLYPIKDLEKKVKQFGLGNFNIDCSSDRKDEIGNLANSFDRSIKKIKELMDARMVFLRNAAHELKTPLTKGMIALELPDTPKKSNTLKGVFTRLNTLISELLDIEKITSGNVKPIKKQSALKDIITNIENILLVEKGSLQHNISSEKVIVDYQLFSLAIKNLVDNGFKYSPSKEVYIEVKEEYFYVVNKGDKLMKPLSYFLEPFSKDNENQNGFGLGLFIVNHILLAHGLTLEYKYEDGCSYFFFNIKTIKS